MIPLSVAAVVIAALAWDVCRRHIATRQQWNETRVVDLEAKLEQLANTGKVLTSLSARLAGVERAVKSALVSDE